MPFGGSDHDLDSICKTGRLHSECLAKDLE